MNIRRLATIGLLAIAVFSSAGCSLFGRKPRATVPSTPAPQVTPAVPPVTTAPVETPKPEPQPVPVEPVPVAQPSEQPAQPKPQVQTPPVARPPRPKPAATPPPTPAPAPPAFGEILTPRQQAQMLQAYEQSAQSARRSLSQLNGRKLNADQTATANRVRSFLKQAEEAKANDPSTAARLAQRAELLASSLLSSIQ